jgi:hypothetical protein
MPKNAWPDAYGIDDTLFSKSFGANALSVPALNRGRRAGGRALCTSFTYLQLNRPV